MPLFGCLTASATQAIYGEAIWNPPDVCSTTLAIAHRANAANSLSRSGSTPITTLSREREPFSVVSGSLSVNWPSTPLTMLSAQAWTWLACFHHTSTSAAELTSAWSCQSRCVRGSFCRRQAHSSACSVHTPSSSVQWSVSCAASTGSCEKGPSSFLTCITRVRTASTTTGMASTGGR